jgi:hypothetical protein
MQVRSLKTLTLESLVRSTIGLVNSNQPNQQQYHNLLGLLILSVLLIPFHVYADKTNQIASTSANVFVNESFTLPAVEFGVWCFYRDFTANITAGTRVFGTI